MSNLTIVTHKVDPNAVMKRYYYFVLHGIHPETKVELEKKCRSWIADEDETDNPDVNQELARMIALSDVHTYYTRENGWNADKVNIIFVESKLEPKE